MNDTVPLAGQDAAPFGKNRIVGHTFMQKVAVALFSNGDVNMAEVRTSTSCITFSIILVSLSMILNSYTFMC